MPNVDIFSFIETIWMLSKTKGQMTRFIFAKSSISMFTIEKTLNQYGVNVYGRSLRTNGDRTFLVTNGQAKYAEYLCLAANYPKLGVKFPENEKYLNAGLPKRKWQKEGRSKSPFLNFGTALSKLGKWF